MKEFEIYSVKQAADVLQCSTKTIYRLIKRNHLQTINAIRHKRISGESLRLLIAGSGAERP